METVKKAKKTKVIHVQGKKSSKTFAFAEMEKVCSNSQQEKYNLFYR